MNYLPEEREKEIGRYIKETGCTVRQAAKYFSLGKSTVHTDITLRLRKSDPQLFRAVSKVLEANKRERHLRGGRATREKYKREREGQENACGS